MSRRLGGGGIISEGGSGEGRGGLCRVGEGGVKDFAVGTEKVADMGLLLFLIPNKTE